MSAPAAPPPPPPPHNNAFIGAHQLPAADRRPTDNDAILIRAPLSRIPADIFRANINPYVAGFAPEGATIVMGRIMRQAGVVPAPAVSPTQQPPPPAPTTPQRRSARGGRAGGLGGRKLNFDSPTK